MLVLVTGSRGRQERLVIEKVLHGIWSDCTARGEKLWLVHGGAVGADQLAEQWARRWNIRSTVVLPDYNDPTLRSRKQAPMRRNLKMLAMKPHLVVAFWDGVSPGTKHTMDNARRREIPVLLKKVGAWDDGRAAEPLNQTDLLGRAGGDQGDDPHGGHHPGA